MKVSLEKTIYTVKAFTNGKTADNSKVPIKTTSWKATVSLPGRTVVSTLVRTKMIRNADKVHLNGLMGADILAHGKTENNMVKEFILTEIREKEKDNGKMVKEKIGWNHHQGIKRSNNDLQRI